MKTLVKALSTVHAINDGTVVLVPTLLPVAAEMFHFGYAELGILVALGYVANVVVQPLVGRYSERKETGTLLTIGMAIMASAMLVIAFSPDYLWVLLGAVVLRVGSSFYHPIGASVTSKTHSGANSDRIMGILSGFGDLGSFVMFLSASILYTLTGWDALFIIFSVIDFSAAFIAYRFLGKIPVSNESQIASTPSTRAHTLESDSELAYSAEQNAGNSKVLSRKIPLWFFFLATLVYGGSYAIILNFANSLMVPVYRSVLLANLPVSLWLAAFVFGDFSTGALSRRFGRMNLLMIAFASSAISVAVFILGYGNLTAASLTLLANGFMLSFTAPLIYSELGSRVLSDNQRRSSLGTLFGVLFSCQIIGSSVFSYLGGEISELFKPIYPFEFIAVMLLGVAILMIALSRFSSVVVGNAPQTLT